MATQEIKIKFVTEDEKSLDMAIAKMVELGKVTEKDAEIFKKVGSDFKKGITDELKVAGVSAKTFSDALTKGATTATTATKSLRTQLQEAKQAAVDAGQKFGQSSEEFRNAAKRAGELKAELGDLNQTLDALDPDAKAKAFNQVGQAAFGAFQVATGALQAFGVENDKVNKLAQQFQGFLNLTQGLSQLGQLGDAMKNVSTVLGFTTQAQKTLTAANVSGTLATEALTAATATETVVTEGATVATSALSKAMTALPLIAIAVLIGAVVKALIDVSDAAEKAADEAKRFADETARAASESAKGLKAAQREFDITSGKVTQLTADTQALNEQFVELNKGNFFNLEKVRDEIAGTEATIASLTNRIASLQAGRQTDATIAIIAQQQKQLAAQKEILKQQQAAEGNLNTTIANNLKALSLEKGVLLAKDVQDNKKAAEEKTKTVKTEVEKTIGELLKINDIQFAPSLGGLTTNLTELNIASDKVWDGIEVKGRETYSDLITYSESWYEANLENINAGLQAFGAISQAITEITANSTAERIDIVNAQFDAEKEGYDTLLKDKAISQAKYDKTLEALDKKREDQIKKLEREQAVREKALAVFNAIINGAAEIIKVSANPALVAITAATIASQLAVIIAQPIPKFAKGTLSVQGGTDGQDSVHAMVMPGEAIIPTRTNRRYKEAVKAIYHESVPADELAQFVTLNPQMRYALLMAAGEQFNSTIVNKPTNISTAQIMSNYISNSVRGGSTTVRGGSSSVDLSGLRSDVRNNKAVKIDNTKQLAQSIADAISQTTNARRKW